jgi:hypothetical protein
LRGMIIFLTEYTPLNVLKESEFTMTCRRLLGNRM